MPPPTPPFLLPLLPARVRRNYRGGRQLDLLAGAARPADGSQPESWLGSTTVALNPGLPPQPGEGLTRVGSGAGIRTLAAELQAAPEFYLGREHAAQLGPQLGFLAKLLDAAIRLHIQVHPTAEFARARLQSPHGKLEVYHILAVRPDAAGEIWLGFQHPPTRAAWRRMIEEQDIAAMAACFEPIRVQAGETWIVPGGLPHAIGPGVLMVEVMEPSDWVVRCEFEREGVVVPPAGRFMGRDLDFCLDVFDYLPRSVELVRTLCRLQPRWLAGDASWELQELAGAGHTRCFSLRRLSARSTAALPGDGRATLVIPTRGRGTVSVENESIAVAPGTAAFAAAAAPGLEFFPDPRETGPTEWLLVQPAGPC